MYIYFCYTLSFLSNFIVHGICRKIYDALKRQQQNRPLLLPTKGTQSLFVSREKKVAKILKSCSFPFFCPV